MLLFDLLKVTRLEFVGKKHEKDDIYSFSFRPLKPFKFIAGKHGFFSMPNKGGTKPFSIASAPEDPEVMITTHVREDSKFKQELSKLKQRDIIKMRGPVLNFTLEGAGQDVVFLAQGIGITPFRSILRHIKADGLSIQTTLLHVDRSDHIFATETSKLATQSFYPTDTESFWKQLQLIIIEQPDVTYYISGAPKFIESTKQLLRTGGIKTSRIKIDRFIGY